MVLRKLLFLSLRVQEIHLPHSVKSRTTGTPQHPHLRTLKKKKKIYPYSTWMSVLPAYVCELIAYQVFTDVQGGHQISGTRATHGYAPPCGCWEQDPGRLEEQPYF